MANIEVFIKKNKKLIFILLILFLVIVFYINNKRENAGSTNASGTNPSGTPTITLDPSNNITNLNAGIKVRNFAWTDNSVSFLKTRSISIKNNILYTLFTNGTTRFYMLNPNGTPVDTIGSDISGNTYFADVRSITTSNNGYYGIGSDLNVYKASLNNNSGIVHSVTVAGEAISWVSTGTNGVIGIYALKHGLIARIWNQAILYRYYCFSTSSWTNFTLSIYNFNEIFVDNNNTGNIFWGIYIDAGNSNKHVLYKCELEDNATLTASSTPTTVHKSKTLYETTDPSGTSLVSMYNGITWTVSRSTKTAYIATSQVINQITYYQLTPFDNSVTNISEICVTRDYVFAVVNVAAAAAVAATATVAAVPAVTASATLYVALNRPDAQKGLIDVVSDKWTKITPILTKNIFKLYAHATCLWIVYTDNTISYIPLLESCENNLLKLTTNITNLNTQITQLTTEKTTLVSDKSKLNDDLQAKITELNTKTEGSIAAEASCKTNIDNLNSQIAQLTAAKNLLNDSLTSKNNECAPRIEAAKNECSAQILQTKTDLLNEYDDKLKTKQTEFTNTCNIDKTSLNNELNKARDELNKANDDLIKQNQLNKTSVDKLDSDNKNLITENNKLKSDINSLNEVVKQKTINNESTQKTITDINSNLNTCMNDKSSLNTQVTSSKDTSKKTMMGAGAAICSSCLIIVLLLIMKRKKSSSE